MSDTPPAWTALIRLIIETRDTPAGTAMRADLSRGINPSSQHVAISRVASYCTPTWTNPTRVALVRAAALAARHTRLIHTDDRKPLGATLRELSIARGGNPDNADVIDGIAARVRLLPDLPFETAVQTIDTLLAFAATERQSINYFALTRSLLGWTNPDLQAQRRHRQEVVNDYYNFRRATKTDGTTPAAA